MKILHVIPFFSPKFGGSVTVIYEISKELARRNHEVTIITTDFGLDSQYADMIRKDGVRVISLPCVAHFGQFLYSPSLKIWLEKSQKDYDVIHLHNFRSYQNSVIRTFAMTYEIPYIIQAHGSVLPFFEKQNLKKLFDLVWGNKILSDASKLIAVSNSEKEQYVKMGITESEIEIIPNGIDVSEYENLPEKGGFRKKYGISDKNKIILYLGRLHKRKGLDFLIQAFSDLLYHYKDVKLVIAGPDDGFLDIILKQIRKLKIDKNVIVTGQLSKKEKFEAFIDADVLVYPGMLEIFGVVPFEAIMCGIPVIVADDCGCGEIIKTADCGYLIKYGEVNEFREKMIFALENPNNNKRLVENGKKFIIENLTWEKLGEPIENLYKCVHSERSNE